MDNVQVGSSTLLQTRFFARTIPKTPGNINVKRSTYYQARLIEEDAQRERKKSRVRHVMTPWFLGAPKSCAFGETLKMCAIDSTP